MNTEPMKHWVPFLNNTNNIKEDWVEIYSNQKTINYISPSNTPIQPKTGSYMKARPKGYLLRESHKHGVFK